MKEGLACVWGTTGLPPLRQAHAGLMDDRRRLQHQSLLQNNSNALNVRAQIEFIIDNYHQTMRATC